MIRIAINGYGRIGRNVMRALHEAGRTDEFEVVAINDLAPADASAHLTKYDSTHGIFDADVSYRDGKLWIDGHGTQMLRESHPGNWPWKDLGIDVVLECAGIFKDRDSLTPHLEAGAPKVLAAYPVADADLMVVYGVNHDKLNSEHKIVSNASCTTNCLAPVAKILHESIGIDNGFMTTIHSLTNDQALIDRAHNDWYRARSATESMLPTKTGAAGAVGKVLPALAGKLDGLAVRVPTSNVSLVDFVFNASRSTSVEEINGLMKEAVSQLPRGVLDYNELPLVSVDFNHNSTSSTFDAMHTRVNDKLVKVMAWYDNEWGYSNRMLDVAALMA